MIANSAVLGTLMFATMFAPLSSDTWFDAVFPLYPMPNSDLNLERRFAAMQIGEGRTLLDYNARSADDRAIVAQSKGLCLLDAIGKLIGPEAFADGLKLYFKGK